MTDTRPPFAGFTTDTWQDTFRLPAAFVTQLLPLVDDLAELKILLFCFWALPQKGGEYPYLRYADFAAHTALMQSLAAAGAPQPAAHILDVALAAAVRHGTLLSAEVQVSGAAERLYFANTARGRTALAQISAGEFRLTEAGPVEILPPRPTIYALYERNIGPLTPMLTDELKDMEKEFPAEWIERAFREAVLANARKLKYIRAVLLNWQKAGGMPMPADSRAATGTPDSFESDGKHYVTGKYADFIQH